jgi:hypothetical protein
MVLGGGEQGLDHHAHAICNIPKIQNKTNEFPLFQILEPTKTFIKLKYLVIMLNYCFIAMIAGC